MNHARVYVFVACLVLVAFVWLIREAWRRRHDVARWALAGAVLFAASGFVFAVPDFYLAVGDLTGVPNLATLLVYASITSCMLTLSVWTSYMIRPIEATRELAVDERGRARVSRWTLVSAVPILTSLVVLFFAAPVHDQPHALDFDATYATEPLVVAFLAVYLTTYVTCLWRIVLLGVRYLRVVPGYMWFRAGLFLISAGALTGSGYAFGKAVSIVGTWFGSPFRELNVVVAPAIASIGATAMAVGYVLPSVGQTVARQVMWVRAYVHLRPLWRALYVVDPDASFAGRRGWSFRGRVHRQVVEIRDWLLRLRPYVDSDIAEIAREHVAALPDEQRAPVVEAVRLTAALDAWRRSELSSTPAENGIATPDRAGLRAEVSLLVPLSRALGSPSVAAVLAAVRV
jgi:hypothetical protein